MSIELTDDYLFTPNQLAEYLTLKPKTLETMRRRGDGPRFIKVGRSVRYLGSDIREWFGDQTRESTTE